MSETYLYSVKPRRPIQVDKNTIIRTPKSLLLTKEDVLTCLEKGAIVYRRFVNEDKLEAVTKYNLDRYHNARFMTEEEFSKVEGDKLGANSGTVTVNDEETPVVTSGYIAPDETPVEIPSETTTNVPEDAEPITVEATAEVIEDSVETDEAESSEDIIETVDLESEETAAEVDQVSGSDVVEDSVSKEDSNNQFKEYKKKKKH